MAVMTFHFLSFKPSIILTSLLPKAKVINFVIIDWQYTKMQLQIFNCKNSFQKMHVPLYKYWVITGKSDPPTGERK